MLAAVAGGVEAEYWSDLTNGPGFDLRASHDSHVINNLTWFKGLPALDNFGRLGDLRTGRRLFRLEVALPLDRDVTPLTPERSLAPRRLSSP